ncbi:MAG: TetR/AcrR family transcriptional regulator [Silicimonas sp.]
MGLRKQQKLDRSMRILEIARTRFHKEGYDTVTIESIAAEAGLSAVTIYNYYGSKANLLLELVRESDVRLIEKLRELISDLPEAMIDSVSRFGSIMRHHAMTYLAKPTWREVLAASILQGGTQFGITYRSLDRALVDIMTELVETYQKRGTLNPEIDARSFANTLYEMQNIRFFLFISDDNQDEADAEILFRRDLSVIFADKSPQSDLERKA